MAEKKNPLSSIFGGIAKVFGWLIKAILSLPSNVLGIIFIALVILVVVTGSGWVHSARTIESRTMEFGLKNIGELATQAGYYTNTQKINKNQKTPWGWDVPLTESQYIFSYQGVIKAGIDFASIELLVDDGKKTVVAKMPEIETLSNEIDTDSFYEWDSRQNIFTPLEIKDVNDSLSEMKKQSEETAMHNGLYESAKVNAELLLKGFLAGIYNSAEYNFEFIWPETTPAIEEDSSEQTESADEETDDSSFIMTYTHA